ncbi:putative non-specific serine/threonine protein kinase [Rosa chinensis]|uniref:Putative non-specific serine/threonine protein kinase n=1 Tax=Rosa chinensis TaxID=74649 RepID=A0A2P6SQD7_ROSCH|nr:putative non-specific serine/threonine protein kinase [Rosa chinensis]
MLSNNILNWTLSRFHKIFIQQNYLKKFPLEVVFFKHRIVKPRTWRGITCGRRRPRVKVLARSSQLKGVLSPHIGNLSFLRTLISEE